MKDIKKRIEEAQGEMSALRSRRKRCMEFAYGRQWGDTVRTDRGRRMSEDEWMRRQGRVPITNNLISRMIRGVVGYWEREGSVCEDEKVKRTDAVTLQELLISGLAVQRVGDAEILLPGVMQISPAVYFASGLRRGVEPELCGSSFEMSRSQVLRLFSGGEADRAIAIVSALGKDGQPGRDKVRVYEVWTREEVPLLQWHDWEHGMCFCTRLTEGHLRDLQELNRQRTVEGRKLVRSRYGERSRRVQRWLLEDGTVLRQREYGMERSNPYVVAMYPGLDGELRSAVEEVIEQQKYINRLVSTLDSVINYSAKGILLYPSDQLPRGMTWRDIRRMWDSPGGILPFTPTRKGMMPVQMNGSGKLDGAMQMLTLQMQLFDDMCGVESSLTNKQSVTGAEMLNARIEQSHLVLRDVLVAFEDMLRRRENMR